MFTASWPLDSFPRNSPRPSPCPLLSAGEDTEGLSRSCRDDDGIPFLLRLSKEHTGFTFERDM